MKSLKWRNVAEAVGVAAIVASLIFVGQQLRLDRKIAIGDAWLQYVDTQVSLAQLVSEHADIWIKGLAGEELSNSDQLRFDHIAHVIEQKYASRFSRSQAGVRAGPAEQLVRMYAQDLFAHKGLRKFSLERWDRLQGLSGSEPSFVAAVRAYLARIDSGEIAPAPSGDYPGKFVF
jgi:hypothetical protein